MASAVARVTRVGWVAGVDVVRVEVVASGVCVVLASCRAWSLVIGGSEGSVVGCGAGFVLPLYPFFDRVSFCLAVSERSASRSASTFITLWPTLIFIRVLFLSTFCLLNHHRIKRSYFLSLEFFLKHQPFILCPMSKLAMERTKHELIPNLVACTFKRTLNS